MGSKNRVAGVPGRTHHLLPHPKLSVLFPNRLARCGVRVCLGCASRNAPARSEEELTGCARALHSPSRRSLSSNGRIGLLIRGDKSNRRKTHIALDGKALLCKMCSGLLSGCTSTQILAMKSRCCSGIVTAAPPLAGRDPETRYGPWPIFTGGSHGSGKSRKRDGLSAIIRAGAPCGVVLRAYAHSRSFRRCVAC